MAMTHWGAPYNAAVAATDGEALAVMQGLLWARGVSGIVGLLADACDVFAGEQAEALARDAWQKVAREVIRPAATRNAAISALEAGAFEEVLGRAAPASPSGKPCTVEGCTTWLAQDCPEDVCIVHMPVSEQVPADDAPVVEPPTVQAALPLPEPDAAPAQDAELAALAW